MGIFSSMTTNVLHKLQFRFVLTQSWNCGERTAASVSDFTDIVHIFVFLWANFMFSLTWCLVRRINLCSKTLEDCTLGTSYKGAIFVAEVRRRHLAQPQQTSQCISMFFEIKEDSMCHTDHSKKWRNCYWSSRSHEVAQVYTKSSLDSALGHAVPLRWKPLTQWGNDRREITDAESNGLPSDEIQGSPYVILNDRLLSVYKPFSNIICRNWVLSRTSCKWAVNWAIETSNLGSILLNIAFQYLRMMWNTWKRSVSPTSTIFSCLVLWTRRTAQFV